jgi:hypothetical protein
VQFRISPRFTAVVLAGLVLVAAVAVTFTLTNDSGDQVAGSFSTAAGGPPLAIDRDAGVVGSNMDGGSSASQRDRGFATQETVSVYLVASEGQAADLRRWLEEATLIRRQAGETPPANEVVVVNSDEAAGAMMAGSGVVPGAEFMNQVEPPCPGVRRKGRHKCGWPLSRAHAPYREPAVSHPPALCRKT